MCRTGKTCRWYTRGCIRTSTTKSCVPVSLLSCITLPRSEVFSQCGCGIMNTLLSPVIAQERLALGHCQLLLACTVNKLRAVHPIFADTDTTSEHCVEVGQDTISVQIQSIKLLNSNRNGIARKLQPRSQEMYT